MLYLTKPDQIQSAITKLALFKILWLDTEVADYRTNKPRLSLIQAVTDGRELKGEHTYILDVLDKPDLVRYFINQIMFNAQIKKVFHNASYDLRFLGKNQAQNVTCTLKIAKKISATRLQVSNLQLKTLAAELCQFSDIDKEEQGSDWGRRPLTEKQLQYAKIDPIYLAHVHRRLLEIANQINPQPVVNISESENTNFSVTNVRVAFECPRLFYLNQHFGGKTLFLPDDHRMGIGQEFHKLAEVFARLIKQESRFTAFFELEVDQLKVEEVATQMQQLFYQLFFFPYVEKAIQVDPKKHSALNQIWLGLTNLSRCWAQLLIKNRRYYSAIEVIGKTFVEEEFSLQHSFTLPNGKKQLVKGQFDSLIFDCDRLNLCVVEYKT